MRKLFEDKSRKAIAIITTVAVLVTGGSAFATYKYLEHKRVEQINIELAKKAEDRLKTKKLEEEKKLIELRYSNGIDGIASFKSNKYTVVITDDEKNMLLDYEERMMTTHKVDDFDKFKMEFDNIISQLDTRLAEWEAEQQRIKEEEERKAREAEETKRQQEQQQQNSGSGGLTASSGVFYFNGRRETYYSSRVLYHHRTPEWWVDGEGFYRTAEGYYVVAASDMAQGTVFQGGKGLCQVLDAGCAAGTTDYYVNW